MKKLYYLTFIIFYYNNSFAAPTWSADIAKIIYGNCTSCHHNGGIAPFSLMTYNDAAYNATDIGNSVTNGDMPPWTPDPNYKRYAHERLLKPNEISLIQQWVANGATSGDLRFAPPAPAYNNASQLGTVDLTLRIPTYTVTSNNDVYRNFVLPSGLANSRYVSAIEIIPGNTEIVHHVLVYQDSTNAPIDPNSAGGTGSSASKLVFGYTPGAQPYYTPVGTGFRLAANTRIILQLHYAPGSAGMIDSTRVNFKLSATPQREIDVNPILNHVTSMTNGPISIPANQTRTFNEESIVIGDWTFLYAFPHMHLIGKSINSYGVDGNDTIPFVNIDDWDFHWQDNFVFPNSVIVPNGTNLYAKAFYDNTTNNDDNPSSPPQHVSAGESTLDEMMIVFFAYMPYQVGDEDLIVDRRILAKGATTFCDGHSIELTTIEGIGYTYQWYKDGNPIAGETNPNYDASQTGNYSVFISLGPNSTYSDTISVTVNSLPVASINPSGNVSIPAGGNVTLNATTGIGYSYQWYLNDSVIAGATDSTYTTDIVGDYTVEVFNGCYSISNPVTLTSPPVYSVTTSAYPIAGGTTSGDGSFAMGTNVTVNAISNTGYAFDNWTDGANVVSTNASYSFTLAGAVNLVANFQSTTGFNALINEKGYAVFPNPSNGRFKIIVEERSELEVYDLCGKHVLTMRLSSGNNDVVLNAKGIYSLRIVSDNKVFNSSLVVE